MVEFPPQAIAVMTSQLRSGFVLEAQPGGILSGPASGDSDNAGLLPANSPSHAVINEVGEGAVHLLAGDAEE